jgi:hypothetical protein
VHPLRCEKLQRGVRVVAKHTLRTRADPSDARVLDTAEARVVFVIEGPERNNPCGAAKRIAQNS